MGLAFVAALVLIYGLIVWEFRDFAIAGLIMSPIPLTLIGIIPGHLIMGAEFTATSMIGLIALGGIIVRQSILIVEFVKIEVARGKPVREAAVDGAAIRMRPILITSLTLMAGAWAIIDDPIFQGMAVSLLFGAGVATLMAVIVIPLGCISLKRQFYLVETESGERMLSDRYREIEGDAGDGSARSARSATDGASGLGATTVGQGGAATPPWLRIWSTTMGAILWLVASLAAGIQAALAGVRVLWRLASSNALSSSWPSTGSASAAPQQAPPVGEREPERTVPEKEMAAGPSPAVAPDAKKTSTKKTPPKKATTKKAASKKVGTNETGTQKAGTRKAGTKKAAAKKTVTKKATSQQGSGTSADTKPSDTSPSTAQQPPARKAAAKKTNRRKTGPDAPDPSSGDVG
jgi:hypothetical protein